MGLFWQLGITTTATVGNINYNNYGRKAAAFFEAKIMFFWTIVDHNYGREAAAFLN